MCIRRSVGHLGRNDLADVKMVQTLLNINRSRYKSARPARLKVDGLMGSKTVKTIRKFELRILRQPDSDGLVTNADPTMKALRSGVSGSKELTDDMLIALMPHALESNIKKYSPHLRRLMPRYGISSKLRVVHFVAQLAHESGSFRYTEEIASGAAYEGRLDLGNTRSGDGKRFKGRGLIQLTGRSNYQSYSEATGVNYVAKPKLLATDPKVAVEVACWFWKSNKLNQLADNDDVRAVTRRINGGQNGIDDRVAFLERARCLANL